MFSPCSGATRLSGSACSFILAPLLLFISRGASDCGLRFPLVLCEGIIVLGSDVRVSPVLSGFRRVGWLRFFLILLGVSLAGGAVWLFTVGGAKVTGDGVTVPESTIYKVLPPDGARPYTRPDGHKVWDRTSEGKMSVWDGSDRLYAPDLPEAIHATCDTTPKNETTTTPNTWSIPQLNQTAKVTTSGHNGQLIELPFNNAGDGTMYADGAKLGATQGAILEGGHVNKAPDLSLSPWGYLHKLKGCEHVYQADETGETHEYVVTDVWTVPHEKLVDTEVYRTDGEPALYMVTCSGPRVGDSGETADGGTASLGFYQDNLIVKAVPVSR